MIAIDVRHPAKRRWKTILPETKDTLEHASLVGGRFIARYMVDAKNEVRVFDLKGKQVGTVALPAVV